MHLPNVDEGGLLAAAPALQVADDQRDDAGRQEDHHGRHRRRHDHRAARVAGRRATTSLGRSLLRRHCIANTRGAWNETRLKTLPFSFYYSVRSTLEALRLYINSLLTLTLTMFASHGRIQTQSGLMLQQWRRVA